MRIPVTLKVLGPGRRTHGSYTGHQPILLKIWGGKELGTLYYIDIKCYHGRDEFK